MSNKPTRLNDPEMQAANSRFFYNAPPGIDHLPPQTTGPGEAYDYAADFHDRHRSLLRQATSMILRKGVNERGELMETDDLHRDEQPGKYMHEVIMLGFDISRLATSQYGWQLNIVGRRKYGKYHNERHSLYAHRLGFWHAGITRFDGQLRQTSHEHITDSLAIEGLFRTIAYFAYHPDIETAAKELEEKRLAVEPEVAKLRAKQQDKGTLTTDDMMLFGVLAQTGFPPVPWRPGPARSA